MMTLSEEEETIFKWNPMADITNELPEDKIDSVLMEIKMNPDIRVKAVQVLSYLYTFTKNSNIPKALELIEDAIEMCRLKMGELEYLGYRFVALGNKEYILRASKAPEEEISKTVEEREKLQPLPQTALAAIHGLRGYTMSLFGDSKYLEGMESFQRAIELDSSNYEWPMGLSILAKRLRTTEEGMISLPTDMEEQLFKRSVLLSKQKKALPLVFLADVYFSQGRGLKGEQNDKILINKAIKLYEKAYELSPESTHILKRCGKAFSVIGDSMTAEKYLLKGLRLDENNAVILHRLGQVYEFSKFKPDMNKAEKYYKLSASGKKRNVFADIDLARIRKKINIKYNVLNHFKEIRQHYLTNPKDLIYVEAAIKRQENYEKQAKQNRLLNNQHFGLKTKSVY